MSSSDSSLHGFLQARILDWVSMLSCRKILIQGSKQHFLSLQHWQTGSLPQGLPGKSHVHADTHTHTHTHVCVYTYILLKTLLVYLERMPFNYIYILSLYFVVQSRSRVWLFATPWAAARQASLSFTISWSLLKLMFIESLMPSSRLPCWLRW